ncbi:class II fructose-1,6-bisphosphate aldolase [Candidatus Soleaferrea massiliensis]|uniref:class II fructose-1,6-bisphosphate aldolase n=1 Tax=Candidatus Soleaferrea massiliensis TaxID=1470354 RepID=UPI00058CC532|nr:class II fructose-1,6-bisphosphate aldolase [Candidatus Soleaferrea massiliensis]
MLVTGKQVLDQANQGGYAVGAFNVNNMEILQAVIAAAEQEKAPVIVQTSEGAIKYAGIKYLSSMVHLAAKEASVPVVLHLDHGTTYETIMQCIANGWTSVMIDGSHFALEENIAATKEIVKVAHACGVSVEAELGRLSGVEDQIAVSEKDALYTDPDEAVRFVKETGVDSLAIAIGTAHGKYKGEPKLDFDRLSEIKKLLDMPIVLHGSSGVPEDSIRKAVSLGVNKINIDTDVRQAFTDGIKAVFEKDPGQFDPRKICGPARDAMKAVVVGKIQMFGSANKA